MRTVRPIPHVARAHERLTENPFLRVHPQVTALSTVRNTRKDRQMETNRMSGMVGRVVDGPHLRFSAKGTALCRFRLECRPYAPKDAPPPERTYFEVISFGSLAANVAESVAQGMRVVVAGKFETDSWTASDGTERHGLKIVAEAVGPDLRWDRARVIRVERGEGPETAVAEDVF